MASATDSRSATPAAYAFLFLGRLHRMARSTTEGWLRKHSDNAFSPWRRRYFALRGDKLEWYKPQGGEQEEKAVAASGSFTVTKDTAITAIEDNCIRLSKGQRSLVLMAGSAEEAQKWRVALTRRSGGTSTRASVVPRAQIGWQSYFLKCLPPSKEEASRREASAGASVAAPPSCKGAIMPRRRTRAVAQGSTRRSRADSEPPQQPWLPTRLAAQGADHIVDRAVMAVNPAYLAERVVEQVNVDRIVEQINVDGIVDRVNVDRIVDRVVPQVLDGLHFETAIVDRAVDRVFANLPAFIGEALPGVVWGHAQAAAGAIADAKSSHIALGVAVAAMAAVAAVAAVVALLALVMLLSFSAGFAWNAGLSMGHAGPDATQLVEY